ncbi:MAG: hypothetical protein HXX10_28710 [Rhodoplanes sp.]|uniref:hypothetical protein n=1 Tax=Rhodoplanes sp. TaxID=1968906 RepID=UPI0018179022|nr:hypothetical protein [Rhodoplanes sp.]NVO18021.1 hypothetical protein [Rhodoplanes sp.]
MERIDDLNAQIVAKFPTMVAARTAHGSNPSPENPEALRKIEEEVAALHAESTRLVGELPAASGLPIELFEAALKEDEQATAVEKKAPDFASLNPGYKEAGLRLLHFEEGYKR